MKLKTTHIAPYAPYALKGYFFDKIEIVSEIDFEYDTVTSQHERSIRVEDFRPILRPLSDLTKEIEHEGMRFIPWSFICYNTQQFYLTYFRNQTYDILSSPYNDIQKLCEWHFDVYNLIPQGLAVDINKV